MKHAQKVQDALDARVKETPKDNQGLHYIKPGSLNRKKGYRRKNTRNRG